MLSLIIILNIFEIGIQYNLLCSLSSLFKTYNNEMSVSRTANKNHRQFDSPAHEFADNYGLVHPSDNSKLTQKVKKLKRALKSSQKHNEELHQKLKRYKSESSEKITNLQEQAKTYRRKLQQATQQHDQQIKNIKHKKQQEIRAFSAGKITNDNRFRDMDLEIKSKDMKIVQLQGNVRDLKNIITSKQQQIKELVLKVQKHKLQIPNQQETKKIKKINDQLQSKIAQSYEYNRQVIKLRQSLRESLKKGEKTTLSLQQQFQKNKHLHEELKQYKKLQQQYKKQLTILKQQCEKFKNQQMQKIRKINQLQKVILQHEFNLKQKQQKYQNLLQKNQKLQQQSKALLSQFQQLNTKHTDLLTTQYQLQRDFQRELHTIVKQLTRRHIMSKSLISSMVTNRGNMYGNSVRDVEMGNIPEYP